MSDKPFPRLPEGVLTEEQLQRIAGGSCTPQDLNDILARLRDNYDTLIDFASYVMERVAGP